MAPISESTDISTIVSYVWLGSYSSETWHPHFTVIDEIDELETQNLKPTLIVIGKHDDDCDAILTQLRQNPRTWLSLILLEEANPAEQYLSNGLWGQNYATLVQKFQLRQKAVRLDAEASDAEKLISFLFMHPKFELQPRKSPQHDCTFEYPLLNAWSIDRNEAIDWLKGIKANGWIETVELNNRVRHCPDCHSGHLNYLDMCPQCQSIDIKLQSSLHCFNCGHIGQQEKFKKATSLMCPNCFSDLRHIGVDYDRPIENQHCVDCESIFIDAKVQAECLSCDEKSEIDDLDVYNIYTYKLSELGRKLVVNGKQGANLTLETSESITNSRFYWLIDWQNKLAKRHGFVHSIMSIEIVDLDAFIEQVGDARGYAQINELQQRINDALRETDACGKTINESLYIFLSMTDEEHIQAVFNKIDAVQELQAKDQIKLRIKTIELPVDNMGDATEAWLIDTFSQTPELSR